MTVAFLGVCVLAFFWMRELPVFLVPQGGLPWALTGVALVVFGLRNTSVRLHSSRRSLLAAVAASALIGALWCPGPFRVGFILLVIASTLGLLPLPRRFANWVVPGVWASGLVCVVQAALVPLLWVFSARYHATADLPLLHDVIPGFPAVPWLTWALYPPLKLVHPALSLEGSTLFLQTVLDTQALTPTWEKLGLFPLVLFLAGAVSLQSLRPDWRRRIPGTVLWVVVFGYVRLLVLLLLVTHLRDEKIFWRFDQVFASFVLLPLVLGAWWHRRAAAADSQAPGVAAPGRGYLRRFAAWIGGESDATARGFGCDARWIRVGALSAVLAGGLIAYWGFHDPGVSKQGRILIDEGHSNWEWTTEPFDTTWYGGRSGYNYYCLADYWNYFYHVESRRDSLTADLLDRWDVLVIKTPTAPFSTDEIDAITEFVKAGGGLFLIGDHTNVFGTSTYLNPIAERFGMYFRYDATYDLATLGLTVFERPQKFAHPVIRFMPAYMFATSCTLYSPLMSENVMLGYGIRAMYLDYSEPSYFPTKEEKLDYDFGLFVQAGGVKCGKGRVLGFTDSTCFSNFFMFIPGKPELALASIEWLNRSNRWAWVNRVCLAAALLGLVLLVIEARRNSGVAFWAAVVTGATITVVLLGSVFDGAVRRQYARPTPQRPITHVTFDQAHGNYSLPVETLPVANWRDFQTFYVWTQRIGLVPRNENRLPEAVLNTRAIVEIQPYRPFTIDEIDVVVDFVRRGGMLIVLDSGENAHTTAPDLLGSFGISFDRETADSVAVLNEEGDTLGTVRKAYAVKDVLPLWTLGDGRTAMGYRSFEKGKVVVCGAAYLFSSEVLGSTAVVPDETRRRIYEAEYSLFGNVAGIRVRGRYMMAEPD
jgi:hypothetical protein